MELSVEICDDWNGNDKVCDSERCKAALEKNGYDCYHRPFKINGKRVTVKQAVLILLRESPFA
jgi:hypothetical protein